MPIDNIGDTLIAFRNRKDETQEQVAAAVGITYVSLSRYETGKRMPKMDILARLAEHYGTTVDVLLGNRTAQEQASMDGLMLDEKRVIDQYRRLTDEGKAKAFEYLLLLQHQYRRDEDAQT